MWALFKFSNLRQNFPHPNWLHAQQNQYHDHQVEVTPTFNLISSPAHYDIANTNNWLVPLRVAVENLWEGFFQLNCYSRIDWPSIYLLCYQPSHWFSALPSSVLVDITIFDQPIQKILRQHPQALAYFFCCFSHIFHSRTSTPIYTTIIEISRILY